MTNKILTPKEKQMQKYDAIVARYKKLRALNPYASHDATCKHIAEEKECSKQNIDRIIRITGNYQKKQ